MHNIHYCSSSIGFSRHADTEEKSLIIQKLEGDQNSVSVEGKHHNKAYGLHGLGEPRSK